MKSKSDMEVGKWKRPEESQHVSEPTTFDNLKRLSNPSKIPDPILVYIHIVW
jgi:hypothetical protein